MTMSRSMSMRMAAAAGSLALVAAVFAGPVAFAADTPDGAIDCLEDTIESKDLLNITQCLCAEQAETMGGMGFDEMMASVPPGLDIDDMLAAFNFDVDIPERTIISESETEVIMDITGTMTMSIDEENAGPFIAAILEGSGQEVTDDMVQMMVGMMASQFETEPTDISTEAVITNDGSGWLVCSDLSGDGDGDGDGQ